MEVNLYGGPAHAKTVTLRHKDISFLPVRDGHYARVRGGLETDFYWHDFAPPMAVNRGAVLVPVQKYDPNKHD